MESSFEQISLLWGGLVAMAAFIGASYLWQQKTLDKKDAFNEAQRIEFTATLKEISTQFIYTTGKQDARTLEQMQRFLEATEKQELRNNAQLKLCDDHRRADLLTLQAHGAAILAMSDRLQQLLTRNHNERSGDYSPRQS